jgi:RimJ/RimL family protein N-acetyltransferase
MFGTEPEPELPEPRAQPTLTTERLVLRPLAPDDAPAVQALIAEREIAANTLTIPHPYPEGGAAEWIEKHAGEFARGAGVVFAVTLRGDGTLVGVIGLDLVAEHQRAEMGYWVGKPYWGNGYATEAARALLRHAFRDLGLRKVNAHHMTRNPASGAVMRKMGMKFEGRLREHILKWGAFEDLDAYAILAHELEDGEGPS